MIRHISLQVMLEDDIEVDIDTAPKLGFVSDTDDEEGSTPFYIPKLGFLSAENVKC
jgi:hypothetical protein